MTERTTPTFAPNLSWLFAELPFDQRSRAASDAGFGAVEFGFPSQVDLDALRRARTSLGLDIILFNQDVPVWDKANRGYLAHPGRRDEFDRELDRALVIAEELEVEKIMLPAGIVDKALSRQEQMDCLVDNLDRAAALAADVPCMLTIEVLNPQDNPGYFLTSASEALAALRLVNQPNVRFQLDTYHLQRIEGEILPLVDAASDLIGHVQFADHPGRHEPGSGDIDFIGLWQALSAGGYSGAVGLEYIPLAPGAGLFDWIAPFSGELHGTIHQPLSGAETKQ